MSVPLIEARHISKRFTKMPDLAAKIAARLGTARKTEVVHALDDINLTVEEGSVLGLAGESGCGKSTFGRIMVGILPPSDGKSYYRGQDQNALTNVSTRVSNLRRQMVFQDPFASLNPRMRIGDAVGEAPLAHGLITRTEYADYVDEMLLSVGLDPSSKCRYPHEFSGGQRQRIGIARAIAVRPEFLVCDEAVASLDVSIQAQILNLFIELREKLQLTYLFISHDLGVIKHLSDRVAIMYLGRIVEVAPTAELYARPNHPYTRALLSQLPTLSNRHQLFASIKGEIPSPINPPSGCHFHPRCPFATQRCKAEVPVANLVSADHLSACHLND